MLTRALKEFGQVAGGDEGPVFALRFNLALNSWLQGRFDEAAMRFEALVETGRLQRRDSHDMCWLYGYLAVARLEQGRLSEACAVALQGVPVMRRAGVLGICTNVMALLAAKLGRPDAAARLIGAGDACQERTGLRHNFIGERVVKQVQAVLEAEPSQRAVEAWLAEGRRFDDDALVQEVEQALRRQLVGAGAVPSREPLRLAPAKAIEGILGLDIAKIIGP